MPSELVLLAAKRYKLAFAWQEKRSAEIYKRKLLGESRQKSGELCTQAHERKTQAPRPQATDRGVPHKEVLQFGALTPGATGLDLCAKTKQLLFAVWIFTWVLA